MKEPELLVSPQHSEREISTETFSGSKRSVITTASRDRKSGKELKPSLGASGADKYNLKINTDLLRLEFYVIIFLLLFF